MGGFAWVTLATNDSYSLGALVLAHSLRRAGSKHDLAVLVTPGVTQSMREKLSAIFTLVQEVNVLDSRDEANLALLARPELGITFTKLHCWRLTQYERCVFVDADTLVVRNCDELFEREELSAAPDVGWPDCFNSGVFVFTPSQQTFASLTAFAASQGSFDGGDQGLLNLYFSDWAHKDISKHLPFIYNMCSTATYSYLPAYKQFGEDVRIIHFIGSTKPWLQYFDSVTGQVQSAPGCNHLQPLLQMWWNIFCANVHPELSSVMASTTLALHWHDILLPMAPIPINTRHHVFHDATDRTTDEIDTVEPDFTEFRDPWDNYAHEEHVNSVRNDYEGHAQQFQINHYAFVSSDDHTCQTVHQSHYHHDHSPSVSVQGHQIEHHAHRRDSCSVENVAGSQTHHDEDYGHLNSQIGHSEHHNQHRHHQTTSPFVDFQSNQTQNCHQVHTYEENRHQENILTSHCHEKNQIHQSQYENHQKSSSIDFQSKQKQIQIHHDGHEDHKHGETQFHEHLQNRLTDITHTCEYVNQQSTNKESYENISSHHTPDRLTGECNDNNLSSIDATTSQSHSQPCTESTSTTTHTEIHTGDIENSDSGIAGALAQLTLGESRSPEQVALEEHMRKYSWEQGQIDYMGRDSFDNIWKKICTTLDAVPPPKENTPPTATTPLLEKEETPCLPATEAAATPRVKEAAPAGEAAPQKADMITESQPDKLLQEMTSDVTIEQTSSETQEEPTQAPTEEAKASSTPMTEQPSSTPAEVLRTAATPPLLSLVSPPPVLSLTSSPPVLSIKEAGEKTQALTPAPKPNEEEKSEEQRETVIPLGYISPTTFESTTCLNLSVSERAQVPQDVPESPVPIQVAESVLEADIKESVSEDIKPVTEEAISSISAPTQESVSAVVETLEAAAPVQPPPPLEAVPSQPNGTGGFDSDIKSDEDTPIGPATVVEAAPLAQPESTDLSFQAQVAAGEIPVVSPPDESSQVPEATVPEAEPQEMAPESLIHSTPVDKSSEPIADLSTPTESPEKSPEPVVEPPRKQIQVPEPSKFAMSTSPEKLPIPGTPTITEATPPTSPQFELAEGQSEEAKAPKKSVKKVMKKSSSDDKTESSEADEVKKPKKVVKKVVKKSKDGEEGGEGSASGEKPKKVVRVVKKVAKGETLQTDSSVPETPPPPAPDTPVPPKRKAKPGTTKTIPKKPDSEQ